jgi:hypothetical protein
MRSIPVQRVAEPVLPLELPAPQRRARRAGDRAGGSSEQILHRLGSDALASHGLPAGTEVIIDPTRTPRRGDVVFARIRGRLRVGVLGTQLGRSVLRSDTESYWIDHTTDVWGVAIAADPPLDGVLP